jgi:hypothetical protein
MKTQFHRAYKTRHASIVTKWKQKKYRTSHGSHHQRRGTVVGASRLAKPYVPNLKKYKQSNFIESRLDLNILNASEKFLCIQEIKISISMHLNRIKTTKKMHRIMNQQCIDLYTNNVPSYSLSMYRNLGPV